MDVEATEFQEWEMLSSNPASDSELFDEIETQKEGLIQANYFSIDSAAKSRYVTTITGDAVEREEVSEKLGNPSWVDPGPGSENWVSNKDSGELLLDSDCERSEDRKLGDFEGKTEVGVVENPELQVGFEGIEEIGSENWVSNKDSAEFLLDSGSERSEDRKFGDFEGKIEVGVVENPELQVGFEGIQEIGSENGDILEVCDSGGIGIGLDEVKFEDLEVNNMLKFGEINTNFEDGSEVYIEEQKQESEKRNEIIEVERRKAEEKKMSLVWWKVPLELLKYCFPRVSPMWTFHMAAALMGFVILGRRLYKMKKKAKALELKVRVDDEKVSQFMSRAARLNEAFSVVKRVPVIQPQLPAAGVTQWPVMSLR